MSALSHAEGHNSVDSNPSQDQCEERETSKQTCDELIAKKSASEKLVHGDDAGQGKFRIYRMDCCCDALGHTVRIAAGAHSNSRLRPRALPEGHINFRVVIVAQPVGPNVMKNTNDLPR